MATVDLPNSITSIGVGAFYKCSSLKRIVLPPNLEKVSGIFGDCKSLEFVKLPNNMTKIAGNIFKECPSLREIVIDSKNPLFICQDSFLFNKEKSILYCFPPGKDTTEIFLPESLKEIKTEAFANCKQLESVIFSSKSFCDIGNAAFKWCTSLRRVDLPHNVKVIKMGTFSWCTSLESINESPGLEVIESAAFSHCGSIKNIDFIPNATQIGQRAFMDCSSLETIAFPNGLKEIGEAAFSGCTSLKKVSIPDSIHSLGDYIFYSDHNLEEIHIHVIDLENVSIMSHAFDIDKNMSLSDIFYSQCILYVPSGTRWNYRHHPVFGKFKNIEIEI
ncbi:MAG: leucine-rich repeat domain-containing protein [Prevotellaceae bacterium]|nr:leucine-rich repeat domain-containing protein [Candidatus Colivivens equi]